MSRKPIKEDERRTEKISLSVTPAVLANIKILADFTHKGNVNGFIVDLLERSIEKNFSLIERVIQGRRDYQSILDAANSEFKNSLL